MKKILFTIFAVICFASIGYSQVTTLWEKSATAGTKPVWETGSLTRGIGYGLIGADHRLYVVSRSTSYGGKQIFIYNAIMKFGCTQCRKFNFKREQSQL